ncbi:tetratricopeptide repeat protein [Alphaproteobacteria bacterium LSUCC0684]
MIIKQNATFLTNHVFIIEILQQMKKNEKKIQELILLFQQGKTVQAFDLALSLSRKHSNIHPVFEILGLTAAQLKRFDIAEKAFNRVILLKPDYAQAFYNLGNVLLSCGKLEQAEAAYADSIRKSPGFLDAYMNLGKCLIRQEKHDQAIEIFDKALRLNKNLAEAHSRKGVAFYHLGDISQAILQFTKALEINPQNAGSYFNRAKCHKETGRSDLAIDDYKAAINIQPAYPEALNNLAIILNEQGFFQQSIKYLEKSIAVDPTYYFAFNNLGNFYKEKKELDQAVQFYIKAIHANKDNYEAYYNLGETLEGQDKFEQALSSFQKSLKINPDYHKSRIGMMSLNRKMCEWADFESDQQLLAVIDVKSSPIPTHMLLSMEDHPERQMDRSKSYAETIKPKTLPLTRAPQSSAGKKIRVGFFSADIKDHPVLHMTSGLFREYDRSTLEVHLFSFGLPDNSDIREEAAKDVDVFHDLHELPENEIIIVARNQQLDIAIDMMGYTKDAKIGLFAQRLAPVQINYLGYPGTLGAGYIDYMIADRHVIGDGQEKFYSEHIIHMPDTFFPSDNLREIAADPKTKSYHGLPEDSFVFCCFNSSYKISPEEFDIWMRVMKKIPGSVLWLPDGHERTVNNLRREAENREVNGDRLIFAGRIPEMRDHLARLQHADLFLDCFNYNAHSTASDALWAGVPLVTRPGEQFAARVASSLLYALGLDQLVTKSSKEYEDLILNLAKDKDRLQKIRETLAANRKTHPLFDAKRYARNFEKGLEKAVDAYQRGIKKQHIFVTGD